MEDWKLTAEDLEKAKANVFRPWEMSDEDLAKLSRDAQRGKILAIEDWDERIDAMLESGMFSNKDVIDEIYSHRDSNWHLDVMNRHPEVFGMVRAEPEKPDTRSVEEVYGGPVSVSYTSADGTTITRKASREEADRLRREEILAIKNRDERLDAITRNIELFRH